MTNLIIETTFIFSTTTSYKSVILVCTIILSILAIEVLVILMNSYIETITSLTYKSLLKNMFVIAIRANAAKVPDSKNKASFGCYWSLTKGGRTLA